MLSPRNTKRIETFCILWFVRVAWQDEFPPGRPVFSKFQSISLSSAFRVGPCVPPPEAASSGPLLEPCVPWCPGSLLRSAPRVAYKRSLGQLPRSARGLLPGNRPRRPGRKKAGIAMNFPPCAYRRPVSPERGPSLCARADKMVKWCQPAMPEEGKGTSMNVPFPWRGAGRRSAVSHFPSANLTASRISSSASSTD
jgi:hypothetical protein